jgi:hypothetical protein
MSLGAERRPRHDHSGRVVLHALDRLSFSARTKVIPMPRLVTVHGCFVPALVLVGAAFGSVPATAAGGGYNDMNAKSVYYDNGHDRDNEVAMLAALTGSASSGYGKYKGAGHAQGRQNAPERGAHLRGANLTADISPVRR